ncbi:Imm52 family immunity protein [Xanthomonas translucens]|uniref:Imm52 family immunity protein n=1 Tax=Xanthomonas campestris pv. translucens TaxID=343 RepID=UPI000A5CDC1B|nr:Imm52 family immunity protein [Xanthomonas translucens]MCS3358825.1 immunity 52 family protein [Xanthomonas translucens pv. translucens]MCS3372994.1 immunity 52 family protein [Xanthomonas translucens pv. translucens]MCT8276051.1 immunity 52 family protein [Xanthomonas translucens pv. translucens]MCT8277139.1 immunity 52 family protein [Xanthomonas translucens pv. translucens]MCT8288198.1 immunity 52 family protein [Xanthomonas translucens pv. translucens]
MINSIIYMDVPSIGLDVESAYDRIDSLAKRISNVVPGITEWYGQINTPEQKAAEFSDRTLTIHRMTERMRQSLERFPNLTKGAEVHLASDNKPKRTPGLVELTYMPAIGRITLMITKPDAAFGSATTSVVTRIFLELLKEEEVEYAFADVKDRVSSAAIPVTYRTKYATFPHRRCLGWMSYVPKVVTKEQLPLAADIIPAKGGSIIVAVNEPFDLANKEHIKRANQIEMDMNDLGLLAVTDPTF